MTRHICCGIYYPAAFGQTELLPLTEGITGVPVTNINIYYTLDINIRVSGHTSKLNIITRHH